MATLLGFIRKGGLVMQVKSIAGILIVFICGITIGFIVCHHLVMSKMHHARKGGPRAFHGHIVDKLTNRLALKQNQEVEVKKIVDSTLKQIHEYHSKTVKVKLDSIFNEAKKKISSNLDETQKQIFEKMPPLFGPKRRGPRHHPPHGHPGGFPPPPPPMNEVSTQAH